MTKRNLNLTCRHCLRSYDEDGKDFGNYGTDLCFQCFETDQEDYSRAQLYNRRMAFLFE